MADDSSNPVASSGAPAVPIAQLGPDTLRDCSVRGVVTIVWPYNSVNGSLAFTLAEAEFRLRRNKGQVRVNFTGPSAKAVAECGIGSGDTVELSLAGVEYVPAVASGRIPGAELDWQLTFSERLRLQVKLGDSDETKIVDIDQSLQPEPGPVAAATTPAPEPQENPFLFDLPSPSALASFTPIKNATLSRLKDGEFESPAFIKRARVSYGSLYEDDIFEDDGGVKGRGRKRKRFGLSVGSWRYSSQSPSPERPAIENEDISSEGENETAKTPSRPQMADSECQTIESDFPEPPPRLSSAVAPRGVFSPAQQPNPFLPNGVFVDSGHQTFPMDDWVSAPMSHSPFTATGFFDGQERIPPFGASPGLGVADQAQQGWAPQPLPGQPATYPELPLEPHQAHAVPMLDPSIDASLTNGFGDPAGSPHQPSVPPGVSAPASDGSGAAHDLSIGRSPGHPATLNYPEPETSRSVQQHLSTHIPTASPFTKPGLSLAEQTRSVPADPFALGGDMSLDHTAVNVGSSSWTSVNIQTANRATSQPETDRNGSANGQTPESAMVIDSGSEDEAGDKEEEAEGADGDEDEEAEGLDEDEDMALQDRDAAGESPPLATQHARTALPQPHRPDIDERPPRGYGITEEEWEDAKRGVYVDATPDRYDDEYDEDESGGDYDTSTYLRPKDDEDDGNDDDLRTRRLEPEFDGGADYGEGQSWDDDEDEDQYDDDEEYESEEELEDDGLEQPQQQLSRPPAQLGRPPVSAPVVIDLLSDSDSDDEEPAPPVASIPVAQRVSLPVPPVTTSPNYGPESDESDEDDDVEDEDEQDEEYDVESGGGEREASRAVSQVEPGDNMPKEGESKGQYSIKDDGITEADPIPSSVDQHPEPASPQQETAESMQELPDIELPRPASPKTAVRQSSEVKEFDKKEDEIMQHAEAQRTSAVESQVEKLGEAKEDQGEEQEEIEEERLSQVDLIETSALEQDTTPERSPQPAQDTAPSKDTQQVLEEKMDITMEESMDGDQSQAAANLLPTPMDSQVIASHETVVVTAEISENASQQATNSEDTTMTGVVPVEMSPTVVRDFEPTADQQAPSPSVSQAAEASFRQEVTEAASAPISAPPLSFQSQTDDSIDAMEAGLTEQTSQAADQTQSESPKSDDAAVDDRSSFVSQSDGDDALQATLGEEGSRMVSEDDELLEDVVLIETPSKPARSERQEPQLPPTQAPPSHENLPGPGTTDGDQAPTAEERTLITENVTAEHAGSTDTTAIEQATETEQVADKEQAMETAQATGKEQATDEEQAVEIEQTTEAEQVAEEEGVPATKTALEAEPTTATEQAADEEAELVPTADQPAAIEQVSEAEQATPTKKVPAAERTEPEIATPGPELSHVKTRSMVHGEAADALDPSVQLARATLASKKESRRRGSTSEVARPHTRSRGSQRSPTPDIADDSVQLAKASLHTPSKANKADSKAAASSPSSSRVEDETSSLAASRMKLVRHLRDNHLDCIALKVLRQHHNESVEIMAIAMMTPPEPRRAKGGPREYMMSFTVTDHSIGPNGVAEVQLYRAHKESLPKVNAGDPVLLRNFTVTSLKGKGYGLRSNDGSSWAVFDREDDPPQIKGPPVEYGEGESTFAEYLREWYGLLDDKARQKLEKANQKIIEGGKAK